MNTTVAHLLREQFNTANDALQKAEKALEDYFLPRLRDALQQGDHDAARTIVQVIPSESLTRVFALDAMRQAGVSIRP